MKTHHYAGWHSMTHWNSRTKALCGATGTQRWVWARVTCKRCLARKASPK